MGYQGARAFFSSRMTTRDIIAAVAIAVLCAAVVQAMVRLTGVLEEPMYATGGLFKPGR